MQAITVEITQLVDDNQCPPLVECLLVDTHGETHRFIEKDAVVSHISVAVDGLPSQGFLACEVEREWVDAEGRSLVSVSTTKPWGIESTAGISTFVVLAAQLKDV